MQERQVGRAAEGGLGTQRRGRGEPDRQALQRAGPRHLVVADVRAGRQRRQHLAGRADDDRRAAQPRDTCSTVCASSVDPPHGRSALGRPHPAGPAAGEHHSAPAAPCRHPHAPGCGAPGRGCQTGPISAPDPRLDVPPVVAACRWACCCSPAPRRPLRGSPAHPPAGAPWPRAAPTARPVRGRRRPAGRGRTGGAPGPGRSAASRRRPRGSCRHGGCAPGAAAPTGPAGPGPGIDVDVLLDDLTVSPRHALLDVDGEGRVVLRDLGAVNG